MRAMVWTAYGPPEGLHLQEVENPVPRPNEVRIRIHATGVAAGDCELRGLRVSIGLRFTARILMGLTRPRAKILGQEFAGEVESVGSEVRRFRVGDPVFGTTGFGFGAYAEYVCVPDRPSGAALAMKPANMSWDEAATVPTGGLEALHFLRRAGELRGRRVLIIGAGGGIGAFAVQLAKYFGAEVTGVDRTEKLDLLRALGADRVVDYTREALPPRSEPFDVLFDVVGAMPLTEGLSRIGPGGRYLLGNPRLSTWIRSRVTGNGGKAVIAGASRQRSEDLEFLTHRIEEGSLRTVIDRRFPLEQLPEAHRYLESGLTHGRVVITL